MQLELDNGVVLNANINQRGGVTISDPKKEGRDAMKFSSQTAEAVLLFAILETLQAIKGQVE